MLNIQYKLKHKRNHLNDEISVLKLKIVEFQKNSKNPD